MYTHLQRSLHGGLAVESIHYLLYSNHTVSAFNACNVYSHWVVRFRVREIVTNTGAIVVQYFFMENLLDGSDFESVYLLFYLV